MSFLCVLSGKKHDCANVSELISKLEELSLSEMKEKDLHKFLNEKFTLGGVDLKQDDIKAIMDLLIIQNYHILNKQKQKYEGQNAVQKFLMENSVYICVVQIVILLMLLWRSFSCCNDTKTKSAYLPEGSIVYGPKNIRNGGREDY